MQCCCKILKATLCVLSTFNRLLNHLKMMRKMKNVKSTLNQSKRILYICSFINWNDKDWSINIYISKAQLCFMFNKTNQHMHHNTWAVILSSSFFLFFSFPLHIFRYSKWNVLVLLLTISMSVSRFYLDEVFSNHPICDYKTI